MQFGIALLPDRAWPELLGRAQLVEELGFDVLMTGDHMRHPTDPTHPFLDGWTVLTAWAAATNRVRLAMYASNLIFRHPVVLAQQAIALDHVSGGRLQLGVGAGVFETDHAMAGVRNWSPGERVARVAESLEILSRLLAGDLGDYSGEHYQFRDAALGLLPIQQPRPPLIVGAQGPRMLRLTARLADGWNTYGGYDVPDAEAFFERTQARSNLLDRECESIGRDPATLSRSVLVHHSCFNPWSSVAEFESTVDRFSRIGIGELIFYWPSPDQMGVFESVAAETLPGLRSAVSK